MRSKFKKAMHQFLEKENISVESGIVNDFTYALAGIKPESNSRGFSFNERYNEDEEKKEKIFFSVPYYLKLSELNLLLKLFKFPAEDYVGDKDLTLDPNIVLNEFLPQFQDYFREIKKTNPEMIAKYKIASAPILESTAESTLTKYIKETKKILLAENLSELTEHRKALVECMILLEGQVDFIDTFPLFYKDILKTAERIKTFLTIPEINENKPLTSKLNMILEGIELYGRYHRNESVLSILAFKKEFASFLVNYQISTKKCDILEHVILNLSGAKQNSPSQCKWDVGRDRSRFVITYKDIDQSNTDTLLKYMRSLGDDTACEGEGERHYGSSLAECDESIVVSNKSPAKKIKIESHTVEIDGNILYKVLYPEIKKQIEKMAAETLLNNYQELSKGEFLQQSSNIRVSTVSMFQAPQTPSTKEEPLSTTLEM